MLLLFVHLVHLNSLSITIFFDMPNFDMPKHNQNVITEFLI